jgi:hypothetical protein
VLIRKYNFYYYKTAGECESVAVMRCCKGVARAKQVFFYQKITRRKLRQEKIHVYHNCLIDNSDTVGSGDKYNELSFNKQLLIRWVFI